MNAVSFEDTEPVEIINPSDIPWEDETDPRLLQVPRTKCAKDNHTYVKDGAVNFSSDGTPAGTPVYRCTKCGWTKTGKRGK